MPASNGSAAPAQMAGTPQPQTTVEPAGGPFIRHSQPGRRQIYNFGSVNFGALVTQPFVAAPGYFRNFRAKFTSTTGGTLTGATLNADAPYNCVSLVQFKDAFGTPILVGGGYEILNLVPLYSGQFGSYATQSIAALPSFSATSATTGAFSFSTCLPLEFVKGYGVISGANASLLPTLQFNMNAFNQVFGSATGTQPSMTVTLESDFYWLPEGVNVEPPGLGTTCQWVVQQANPTIPANSSMRVQCPRLGGYLTTLIFILRDSLGNRVDAWPSELQVYVDGVPWIDSQLSTLFDDMAITWPSINTAGNNGAAGSRPTGVLAISRKTSMAQEQLGLLDTGEVFLSTNPGTLIEVNGSPWGTGGTPPYTLNVLMGQVVPTQALIQGLPEV